MEVRATCPSCFWPPRVFTRLSNFFSDLHVITVGHTVGTFWLNGSVWVIVLRPVEWCIGSPYRHGDTFRLLERLIPPPKTRRSAASRRFFLSENNKFGIKCHTLIFLQEIRINDNKLGLEKQSLYQDCLQIQAVIWYNGKDNLEPWSFFWCDNSI